MCAGKSATRTAQQALGAAGARAYPEQRGDFGSFEHGQAASAS